MPISLNDLPNELEELIQSSSQLLDGKCPCVELDIDIWGSDFLNSFDSTVAVNALSEFSVNEDDNLYDALGDWISDSDSSDFIALHNIQDLGEIQLVVINAYPSATLFVGLFTDLTLLQTYLLTTHGYVFLEGKCQLSMDDIIDKWLMNFGGNDFTFFVPSNFYNHPRYIAAKNEVQNNISKNTGIHPHPSRVHHVYAARLGIDARKIETSLKQAIEVLPAGLEAAYINTSYVVDEKNISLRIGRTNPQLLELYREKTIENAVFITSENPDSITFDSDDNKKRMDELAEYLRQNNYEFFPGKGVSKDTPDYYENSFLVLGLECDLAVWLASYYGQLAFVYCDNKAIPKLVIVGGTASQAVHSDAF